MRLNLRQLLDAAAEQAPGDGSALAAVVEGLFAFVIERLVVQLRADGARYDILNAVFGAKRQQHAQDGDLVALLARTEAVAALLTTPDGVDLLAAHRRAANILRIEDRKDGPHDGPPDPDLLREPAEAALFAALQPMLDVGDLLRREEYATAMAITARLRPPLDAFFENVTVNSPEPDLRRNRLRLLAQVRSIMDQIADFSRIEG